MKYRFLNNITGWLMFFAAFVVYTMTAERSVSLWDCGEFLSALYKLQVVHPPGAPFFLMVGRFFTLFAFGDPEMVGFMGNMVSVTTSALTVLFTYWCTTLLAKRILTGSFNAALDSVQKIKVVGSGIVAALALTFMDTFWFSAVEAEVYAMSSFLTALSFWAILKWGTVHDRPGADRWLILLAYVIGLSIGTHLLNLLVIPAIVYFYYFTKYKPTTKGFVYSSVAAVVILGFIQSGIIPGIPTLGAWFDRIFVNGLGMPFYSGMFFFLILLTGGIVYGLMWTAKNKKYLYNKIILGFAFVCIGYSCYAMVVIRAAADPAINMNDPDDPYNLVSYINREQYGDRPLLYGPYFTAKNFPRTTEEGAMDYRMDTAVGKYVETGRKLEAKWSDKHSTIFPRMGDMQKGTSPRGYMEWSGAKGGKIKPTMGQNIKFMFDYQIGHMYWRYLMWNFSGRQDDIQGHGGPEHGNWISGIGFIDNMRLGPQSNLPDDLKVNKGRNKYYLLPFILGILGAIYQYKKHKNDFVVVLALFLFTGLMIVIYLNQPPYEPRERDYSFVGSFQTFCIWIGLAVLFIADMLSKYLDKRNAAIGATVISLLAAPVLMGAQNWDDHDRSNRSIGIDHAYSYLEPLKENAILFTNGDNDTYPLWFARNVVNMRTDTRIINFALLSSDWYTQPLKDKVYDSEPLPVTYTKQQVADGVRDVTYIYDQGYNEALYKEYGINPPNQPSDLRNVLKFVLDDDQKTKVQMRDGTYRNYFPTRQVYIPIDKQAAKESGLVLEKDFNGIVDRIDIKLGGDYVFKGDLVFLDLIAHNNWERPIYLSQLSGVGFIDQIKKYFLGEGLVHRFVPVDNTKRLDGDLDTEKMYENFMKNFKYAGMSQGESYYLDDKASIVPNQLRILGYYFGLRLIGQAENIQNQIKQMKEANVPEEAYMEQEAIADSLNKTVVEVLDKLRVEIPENVLPMRPDIKFFYITFYQKAGAEKQAKEMMIELVDRGEQNFKYLAQFKGTRHWKDYAQNLNQDYLKVLSELSRMAKEDMGDDALAQRINSLLQQYGV